MGVLPGLPAKVQDSHWAAGLSWGWGWPQEAGGQGWNPDPQSLKAPLHCGPSSPTEAEAVVSGMTGGAGEVGFPGTGRVLETQKDSARETGRIYNLVTDLEISNLALSPV